MGVRNRSTRSGGDGDALRQALLLVDQPELHQQGVHRVLGDVDVAEAGDAVDLLAEVAEPGAAALAAHQVCLQLAFPAGFELPVQVAAEDEEAAFHMAISR